MNHDLDYGDLNGEGPDTIAREVSEMVPTLHEIPLDEEPNQLLVFKRANPVTLLAEEKTYVVNELNKVLDQLYNMRIAVNRALLMIDRGG